MSATFASGFGGCFSTGNDCDMLRLRTDDRIDYIRLAEEDRSSELDVGVSLKGPIVGVTSTQWRRSSIGSSVSVSRPLSSSSSWIEASASIQNGT